MTEITNSIFDWWRADDRTALPLPRYVELPPTMRRQVLIGLEHRGIPLEAVASELGISDEELRTLFPERGERKNG